MISSFFKILLLVTVFSMATTIELEDYDLKRYKGYLAFVQKIDTTNAEYVKSCPIGSGKNCFYYEENKLCSQSLFLIYDFSLDEVMMETRKLRGFCNENVNKLIYAIVDSNHVVAAEAINLYSYDMSGHMISLVKRWNLMWELYLESVLNLQKNKKIVKPSLFVKKKLNGLTVNQIRDGLKIYIPKSDIWGFGKIVGYVDSTLQNKKVCVLKIDSLNTSKKINSEDTLFYIPNQCSLNKDLFEYVNIFAAKKESGYKVDSITSPVDQILIEKNAIDITFGTKYHDEVKTIIPENFSLEEMYYVGIANLFNMNDSLTARKTAIPKEHLDSLFVLRERYYEKVKAYQLKVENLKSITR